MQRNVPRPGCYACLLVTWDVDHDRPPAKSIDISRLTILEPPSAESAGAQYGMVRVTMLERMPKLIPEWVVGFVADKAVMGSMQQVRWLYPSALATFSPPRALTLDCPRPLPLAQAFRKYGAVKRLGDPAPTSPSL